MLITTPTCREHYQLTAPERHRAIRLYRTLRAGGISPRVAGRNVQDWLDLCIDWS